MLGRGIEISKSVSDGKKPVTKIEVKKGSLPRRRRRVICPVFKGSRRA